MINPPPRTRPRAWPQPSPIDPSSLAPVVLFPEPEEGEEFERSIGERYRRTVTREWPGALAFAVRTPAVHLTDDDEFCALFWNTSMSRRLCPTLDPIDQERFASVLEEVPESSRLYKIDATAMERLVPLPGFCTAPSVALIELDAEGRFRPLAIRIRDLLLRPEDGHAWSLAKVYVLHSALFHMLSSAHYPQHFPLDAIIAVTGGLLPEGHLLRRFMEPHSRFTLELNNAALHSHRSAFSNQQRYPWSHFAYTGVSIYKKAALGWVGLPGNSAYPAYRFEPHAPGGDLPFDRFLRGYYERMAPFGEALADALLGAPASEMEGVRRWAEEIAGWIPGFPDAEAITERATLAGTLTRILWQTTVAHAADHYTLGRIPIDRVPIRLRVPPPETRKIPAPDPRAVWTFEDRARQWMNFELFVGEKLMVPLLSVRYGLGSEIREANEAMHQRLIDYDRSLDVPRFIPVERISASIEY